MLGWESVPSTGGLSRDLLLQIVPHGPPRRAVPVPQTLPWALSVSGLSLTAPCGHWGDAGEAPLSWGAAETSPALRLVSCWSWETGAGCDSSGERRENPFLSPFPLAF